MVEGETLKNFYAPKTGIQNPLKIQTLKKDPRTKSVFAENEVSGDVIEYPSIVSAAKVLI